MKRTFKIIGVVLGGLFLIALLLVIAMLISWNVRKDEALLPEVAQIVAPRPEPPKEQNGFYIHMGINAAAGKDAAKVGMAIVEAANKFVPTKDVTFFMTPAEIEGTPKLEWAPKGKGALCKHDQTPCLHIYRESPVAITAKATNEELMARYLGMQRLPHYQFSISASQAELLPNWLTLLRASETVDALSARSLADPSGGEAALSALAADFRYWRWQLAFSENLAQRMISAGIMDRKLFLLSEIISAQPTIAASPRFAEMTTPLTGEERNMQRAMSGEVKFAYGHFLASTREMCREPENMSAKIGCKFGRNAYKQNATTNLHYVRLMRLHSAIGDTPKATIDGVEVERALQAEYEGKIPAIPRQIFYNPIGDFIAGNPLSLFSTYYARNADLEVRFKLVEAKRRIIASDAKDIPAAIAALPPELMNSYTDKPFEWDAKTREMWFTPAAPRNKDVMRISVKF
jgi:hypothetical protein